MLEKAGECAGSQKDGALLISGADSVEQELDDTTAQIQTEIDFIRQKSDADLVVAKKNLDAISALGKQLDNAVYVDGEKAMEWKAGR